MTSPPSPNSTSFRSSVVETIVKTTSQPASSIRLPTTSASNGASASALLRVRFHTLTPIPACSSRRAIASPMRPSPIHPMRFVIDCSFFPAGPSCSDRLLPVLPIDVPAGVFQPCRRIAETAAQFEHRAGGLLVQAAIAKEPAARIEHQVA